MQDAKSASVKEVKRNQDTKNKAEKLQVQNQQKCQVNWRTENTPEHKQMRTNRPLNQECDSAKKGIHIYIIVRMKWNFENGYTEKLQRYKC